MTTKLTLSNENGTYSVEIDLIEINVTEMIDALVVPLMLAAGYPHQAVAEHLKRDDLL